MGKFREVNVPKIPLAYAIEENMDSQATALMCLNGIQKFQQFELLEDNLKNYIKEVIENYESYSKERLFSVLNTILTKINIIDDEQDKIIEALEMQVRYIKKINYESNKRLKFYDVKGPYWRVILKKKKIVRKKRLLFENILEEGMK